MNFIEVSSLPQLKFAHRFEANNYTNNIPAPKDKIEISYIFEGESTTVIEGKSYHLKQGDIVCNIFDKPLKVEANAYHCHHTVCASLKYEFAENDGLYLPYIVPHSKYDDEIKKIIDSFIYRPHIYHNSATKSANLFLNLLLKIDEASRNTSVKSGENLIYKAKKYIYENINRPITQGEIAEFLGISPEYLSAIFKKSEGVPVIKFINTVKLKNIKILMWEKNLKLYEASSIYGYSDPNYVSMLHKKIFGYNITDKPDVYNKF